MISFRIFARAAGVFVGLAVLGTAHAASTVESLGGTVRVNRGTGFVVLQGTDAVKAGDTIMVDPKGKGRLVYGDGCTVNVKPGSLVTVAEVSPCSLTAQAPNGQDNTNVAPPAGPGTGLLIAGGAAAVGGAIAGGVAAANSGGGGGSNLVPFLPPKPASP